MENANIGTLAELKRHIDQLNQLGGSRQELMNASAQDLLIVIATGLINLSERLAKLERK